MKSKTFHICVATSRRIKAGRSRFSGIMRYAAERQNWIVRFVDPVREDANYYPLSNELADDEPVDGAIGHFDTIRRYLGSRFADIPVVIMNNSYRKYRAPSPTVRIVADDDAIGKAAADLFVKRGLRHIAFVSDISQVVSESLHHAERMESFRKAALAADATCDVFRNATDAQTDNISQLADWLANLPLPCGVMAYNDSRAQTVIDACHMAHLRIPDQIQVVGVDNEVEICENTVPTLTSILPDFEGSGYLAAQLLDKMLAKGMPRKDIVYKYGVKSVVERASTQDLRGGGRLVTQACEFIRLHAGEKIDVDSVAKAQKVSRRTLEMRFREIMNEGVGEVLRRHRLERVCSLLKETHRSISDISYDSGFASPTHLKAAFKKAYGKTMGEWRSGS